MKIILSNIIQIADPTKEIVDYCKSKLTFKNPDYEKKKRMGFYVYGTPKEIKLYNIYDNSLYIPYGFFEELWKIHPIENDYIDYTSSVYRDIKSNMTLRDYQKPSVQALKEHYSGIFNIVVGLGKTNMALHCASELKEHTLWLTHSHELLEQSMERAKSTLECSCSTITEGKKDTLGDIVFATVQSVIKFIQEGTISQNEFGYIVVDECQKIKTDPKSIELFRTCIEYFNARYKVGLSGSVHRADGLQDCIYAILGKSIYSIYQRNEEYLCEYNGEIIKRFPSDTYSVLPIVRVIETKYDIIGKDVFNSNGGTIQFASLITDLATDKDRNKLIIDTLKDIKGSTIVLSDRIEQLKYLCSSVENGVQIDGATPKKDRKKALDDVRSGKTKYLFASYNLCKEGLDCPILENLVMATPVKDYAAVVQSIGRIMRTKEGKTSAVVYDFCDSEVGMLLRFYSKRRSIYKKNNWKIENTYLGGGK